MNVAIVQMSMTDCIEQNTASILRGLSEAKDQGAQVAVFPEFATTGFHMGLLEGVDSPSLQMSLEQIGRACASCDMAAVVGTPYFAEAGMEKPWNAVVVFDEAGKMVAVCPKVDLDEKGEARVFTPGAERSCFWLLGRKCAIVVCREIAWPVERLETLWGERPEIIFWPGLVVNSDENAPMAQAVAIAFKAWLVQATWANWLFRPGLVWGRSWVINPCGQTVHESAANEPCVCVVNLALH